MNKEVMEWIVTGETGISSKTIWAHFVLAAQAGHHSTPSDPSDFLRCYWLLKWAPEWVPRMSELGERYPNSAWGKLAEHWGELSQMLEAAWPKSCASGRSEDEPPATEMYKRMKELGC